MLSGFPALPKASDLPLLLQVQGEEVFVESFLDHVAQTFAVLNEVSLSLAVVTEFNGEWLGIVSASPYATYRTATVETTQEGRTSAMYAHLGGVILNRGSHSGSRWFEAHAI